MFKNWKCSTKKAISATYDEGIEMWEKVVEGASPGYTCYVSRKTMRKKMSNLHQILKKAEDPSPKRHTSFSIFQKMISISASVLRIITLFRIKRDFVKLLLVVKVQSWLKKAG